MMKSYGTVFAAFLSVTWFPTGQCWAPESKQCTSRSAFFQKAVAAATVAAFTGLTPSTQAAAAAATESTGNKLLNLSNEEIKKFVLDDIVERDFLVTGKLTRSIYDESATFTDEIDTYKMDQWMKGTQKLFVGEGSKLDVVGDVKATEKAVEFRFEEDLMFRIPLRPVVHLTGKVVLTRSPETGLITAYREFWDQDVATVLRSAKF